MTDSMLTALLVLARIGTANVVELGTARATGEVEALEALGIDPVATITFTTLSNSSHEARDRGIPVRGKERNTTLR